MSNLHPDADFRDFDDDDWQECEDCDGTGRDDSMCQCKTCGGKGGWLIDYSAEAQALDENDNDTR